jgi:DNA-binding NarL/FixJ family response regulator
MPGNGIRAASLIHERAPFTVIVMLTIARDDDHIFAALKAGADGYLLKETDPRRLPAALTGVLAGEAALPRALVARVIDEFRRRDGRNARIRAFEEETNVALTAREWDVLEQLGAGRSTAEIAELLGIAPVTVRTHVAAVLRKLHLRDREAVVRRLQGPGVDPPLQ